MLEKESGAAGVIPFTHPPPWSCGRWTRAVV